MRDREGGGGRDWEVLLKEMAEPPRKRVSAVGERASVCGAHGWR